MSPVADAGAAREDTGVQLTPRLRSVAGELGGSLPPKCCSLSAAKESPQHPPTPGNTSDDSSASSRLTGLGISLNIVVGARRVGTKVIEVQAWRQCPPPAEGQGCLLRAGQGALPREQCPPQGCPRWASGTQTRGFWKETCQVARATPLLFVSQPSTEKVICGGLRRLYV